MILRLTKGFGLFLIFLVTIIGVGYICLWGYVNVYGKDILLGNIHKTFGVKAQVDSVSFFFPLSIKIKNFQCKDLRLGDVHILLGGYNIFNSHATINKICIDGLHLRIKRYKKYVSFEPVLVKDVSKRKSEGTHLKEENFLRIALARIKKKRLSCAIKNFYIKNWTGEIIDCTRQKPIHFSIRNGEVKLRNFFYPRLKKFCITIKATLETDRKSAINKLSAQGWIDFAAKNMDVRFTLDNLDYKSFSDYYPSFWKPDNLGIKKAMLTLRSHLKAHNNNLNIDNELSLENIAFRDEGDEPSHKLNFFKKIVSIFQHYQEKPTYQFTIKTKMDAPRLDASLLKEDFVKAFKNNGN